MTDTLTTTQTGSLDPTPLSDKAVSYLRTVVPVLWGSAVTWLLANVPALSSIPIDLSNATVAGLVTSAAIALWYVLWRAIEKKIPNWLTTLVLGSSKQPAYAGTPGDPVVEYAEPVVEDHAPDNEGDPPAPDEVE